jgi:hypothetical protein
MAGAFAWDDSKYPDFSGQWRPIGGPGRFARDQKAPLTPEYQAIFDATKAEGGQGTVNMTYLCFSPGMPRAVNGYGEIEFVIAPTTFHILVDHIYDNRRIFTDGRPWPEEIEPTLLGYSIGQWIDTKGTGKYDVLEVETRFIKGPRTLDGLLPTHADNQTVVKERLYIDKANPNVLRNEITLIDHAYTRPWSIVRNYPRYKSPGPTGWPEEVCAEAQVWISLGKEDYFLSSDGYLMPTKKDQAPPDLRYFKPTGK